MALEPDDPLAPPTPKLRSLEVMSIDELRERRADLEAEIEKIDAAIAAKQDHRSAAELLFKAPPSD